MLTDSFARSGSGRADGVPPTGAVLRERYELEQRLEHGRLGHVFRARDRHDASGAPVAVLILPAEIVRNPRQIDALRREFSTVQALSHPNLVELYDFDRDGDTNFIVMEYVDGESLRSVLDCLAPERLAEVEAMRVGGQVGAALSHAHAAGIVHGDVRAENVIVSERGEVKLLLSSACLVRSSPFTVDYRDDVQGIAMLIYELLSGSLPAVAHNPLADEEWPEPEKIRSLSRRHWSALREALLPHDRRTQTIDEFLVGMDMREPRGDRAPAAFDPPTRPIGWGNQRVGVHDDERTRAAVARRADPRRADPGPVYREPPTYGRMHEPPPPPVVDPWRDERTVYRPRPDRNRVSGRGSGLGERLLRRATVAAVVMALVVAGVFGALRWGRDGLNALIAMLPLGTEAPAVESGSASEIPAAGGLESAADISAAGEPEATAEIFAAGEPRPETLVVPPPTVQSSPTPEAEEGPATVDTSRTAEPEAGFEPFADAETRADIPPSPGVTSSAGVTAVPPGSGGERSDDTAAIEPESAGVSTAPEPPPRQDTTAEPAAAPGVSLASSQVTVNENQSFAPIEVRRGSALNATTIVWWAADESATADDDYADLGRVVDRMEAGETRHIIYIPIVADSIAEPSETFRVHVSEINSATRQQQGSLATATVTIIDDDR